VLTRDQARSTVPTYEYRCKDCEHSFDVVQSFTDDPLTECPSCGGPLRKVFGNVGITFKGSGFYKTDSRSSSNGKKPDAAKTNGDAGSTKESSSSSESKKDSPSSKGDSGSSGSSGSKSTTPA
jgi:putative FmdB family regulatory protein